MKLTGKCKKDFEKWYKVKFEEPYQSTEFYPEEHKGFVELNGFPDGVLWCNGFYDLPKSMQYGVYVDFFDSVGIYIDIEFMYHLNCTFNASTQESNGRYDIYENTLTRPEARTKVIEKANEIYNEK